jgi:hypothetical protein
VIYVQNDCNEEEKRRLERMQRECNAYGRPRRLKEKTDGAESIVRPPDYIAPGDAAEDDLAS